jgi:uncharacterized protein YllA (UPF0747 family)
MSERPAATTADPWPEEPWLGDAALAESGARLLAGHAWERAALGRILSAHAGSPQARAQVAALLQPGTAAVVTGQQPAYGGGPLYSLVKTAHALALARRLSAAGLPSVAVFWCASEDHDVGEAGHADLVLRDGSIRRLAGALGGGHASLRHRPAAATWAALVAGCREHLGAGLGAGWLEAHQPLADEGYGAWLCRLMAALFASQGLLCVEGHQLRPLWTATVGRALDAWPGAALAAQRARRLAAGGGDAFGELAAPPLFADRPAGRSALDPGAARALLAQAPLELSPGAALRPVLQQAALPCVAYVAGPGELSYHHLIAPLYAALGVPRPALVRRCSLTLVPGWVERAARAWGATTQQVVAGGAAPRLASDDPAALLGGLAGALAALDRSAAGLADGQRARLVTGVAALRRAEARLAASLARGARQAAGRPAWGALHAWLAPRGQPQERTMSLFQAIWEHGPGLADRLVAEAAEAGPGAHRLVALGSGDG